MGWLNDFLPEPQGMVPKKEARYDSIDGPVTMTSWLWKTQILPCWFYKILLQGSSTMGRSLSW